MKKYLFKLSKIFKKNKSKKDKITDYIIIYH